MRLLIACSQFFGLVTLDRHHADIRRIHQGRGVYTGISWSDEHVYVASLNNQGCWDDDNAGPDWLLRYDRQLQLCDHIEIGARDIHQIHWHRDRLLICDTGHDRLLSFPRGESWTLPDEGLPITRPVANRHHLNSVWCNAHDTWLLARYGSPVLSEAWRVDLRQQRILERVPIGCEAHNLCVRDDTILTCSSGDEAFHLVGKTGIKASVDLQEGYPRGLTHLGRMIVIGTGARGPREIRHRADAKILLVRHGAVYRRYRLADVGQIYTLRAVDGIDWAHQGDWGPRCPISVLA